MPCSGGIRPHVSEEFCNTVTETEGGFCGGSDPEEHFVEAGAFCKFTFCPAPDEGRRLDELPLLTAAVSKPTPASSTEETDGSTPEPTCRPCMTQSDCDGTEFCEVLSARRGLRFGSIQQEGCCRAR